MSGCCKPKTQKINNKPCCNKTLVTGYNVEKTQKTGFMLSYIFVYVTSQIWPGIIIKQKIGPIFSWIHTILFILGFYNFLACAYKDPGFIPRGDIDSTLIDENDMKQGDYDDQEGKVQGDDEIKTLNDGNQSPIEIDFSQKNNKEDNHPFFDVNHF